MTDGNGKTAEWLRFLGVLILSGVVSYLTTVGTLQTRVSVAESQLQQMQEDIRDLKSDMKLVLQAVR